MLFYWVEWGTYGEIIEKRNNLVTSYFGTGEPGDNLVDANSETCCQTIPLTRYAKNLEFMSP
jgi:hypothetical protein